MIVKEGGKDTRGERKEKMVREGKESYEGRKLRRTDARKREKAL